jgi:hypothetical protein
VLRLLQRVPQEEVPGTVVTDGRPSLGLTEQRLGQCGRVVLERRRDGEVGLLVEEPLPEPVQFPDIGADRADGIPQLGHAVVEHCVLPAVHPFLADETLDVPAQTGLRDAVPHRVDGPHEVGLALRERRRQHREDMAQHQVAVAGEVPRYVAEPRVERHGPGRYSSALLPGGAHPVDIPKSI